MIVCKLIALSQASQFIATLKKDLYLVHAISSHEVLNTTSKQDLLQTISTCRFSLNQCPELVQIFALSAAFKERPELQACDVLFNTYGLVTDARHHIWKINLMM